MTMMTTTKTTRKMSTFNKTQCYGNTILTKYSILIFEPMIKQRNNNNNNKTWWTKNIIWYDVANEENGKDEDDSNSNIISHNTKDIKWEMCVWWPTKRMKRRKNERTNGEKRSRSSDVWWLQNPFMCFVYSYDAIYMVMRFCRIDLFRSSFLCFWFSCLFFFFCCLVSV